jgi:hypothetical protein
MVNSGRGESWTSGRPWFGARSATATASLPTTVVEQPGGTIQWRQTRKEYLDI